MPITHSVTLSQAEYEALQAELQHLRQQAVQTASLREQALFAVIQKIRASLDLNEILATTVTEVREILHADRVAIFEFLPETEPQSGTFVIEDCLAPELSLQSLQLCRAQLGELFTLDYEQGQGHAVINSDVERFSRPEPDADWAQLQIRAYLVVPLWQGEVLWGLLAVHQCYRPREWQPEAIEFVQQIGVHLSVALDQALLLAQTQKQAAALAKMLDQLAIRVTQQSDVLDSLEDDRRRIYGQLYDREAQLQQFVEHTPAAVAMFDTQMRYLLASQRWRDDYGLGDRPIMGRSHYEIFPEIPERWQKIHQRCLTGMVERCADDRFERLDGSVDWINWEIRPWYEETGAIGGIIMFTEVVTWRKQAEEQLRALNEQLEATVLERTAQLQATQAQLHKIATNLPGMLFQYALTTGASTGHFTYTSPGSRLIFGQSTRTLDPEFFVLHPDDYPRWVELIRQSARTLGKLNYQGRVQSATGAWRWIEAIAQPESQPDGTILWDGILFDISDRKQTEQALREAQRLAQIGNWRYDLAAGTLFWSAEIFRILGHPIAAGEPELPVALDYFDPRDRDGFQAAMARVQATQVPESLELRLLRPGPATGHVHVNISATTDVQGRVTQLYGILMDITQRKSAQLLAQEQANEMAATLQELQQTQSQLIHSEKLSSLGQLVAGIAHEINNPINFISGNLTHASNYARDLLTLIEAFEHAYPHPPEPLAEQIAALDLAFLKTDLPNLLESMNVGAQRIVEIVTSLRNFSRLDEMVPQVVDLHEGIESTLMILRHRCKATGSRPGITIHRDYGELPAVECYPGPLNQVFMNILANALDAMDERRATETGGRPGEIWLRTRFDPSRDQVILQIRDNGPGIPEAAQTNIFAPFFTTKVPGKGTGMGLSISQQIVTQRHHGHLHFVTCADSGTVFTVILPRLQPGAAAISGREELAGCPEQLPLR